MVFLMAACSVALKAESWAIFEVVLRVVKLVCEMVGKSVVEKVVMLDVRQVVKLVVC